MKLLSLHHYGLPWPEQTINATDLVITGPVGATGKTSAQIDRELADEIGEAP